MKALQFVLVGHPVGHSLSPAIHGEVYRHFQLPHRYQALDCPDEHAVRAVFERLRSGDIHGANVTVPWKRLALQLADRLDESAAQTGAANVLLRTESGEIVAHNTDVPALAERLALGLMDGEGGAVVLGNGGAALAAVSACKSLGVEVGVSGRSWRGEARGFRQAADFERLGARLLAWDREPHSELQRALCASRLVVQATSAGMTGHAGGEALCAQVPFELLRKDCFAYDLVYNPGVTPFLEQAQRQGLRWENGLSMLVGQAALAIELWLGMQAPKAKMMEVAERLLGERGPQK
jgi:shikimate dehydrogenase